MVITILLLIFYLLMPVLLIYLCQISKTINKIGAVVLAYGVGLIAGNAGILPKASEGFAALLGTERKLPGPELLSHFNAGSATQTDLLVNQIATMQDMIISVVIPLAIPMLLFSLDLKRWLKLARGALFSLLLGLVSLMAVIFLGYYLLGNKFEESWKVAGMLVGAYSGGSPNLAAIGTALNVSPNTFVLTNTYDMMIGAIILFFLMTFAQQTFNMFLPKFYDKHKELTTDNVSVEYQGADIDDYTGIFRWNTLKQVLMALGLAVIILALAGAMTMLVPQKAQDAAAIITVTTLGLIASNIDPINKLKKSFQAGMYLVIIFSLVIASLGNLREMFRIEYLNLFLFVAMAVIGSIIIHAALSWIFRIDADTLIITIAGLTYSPPFVPVVAGSIRNKDVIITGLTTGIIGYAIGNYLGISIGYMLK